MIDRIVDGITKQLKGAFSRRYIVYTNAVEQGLKEPCFFVQLVSCANTRELNKRFLRQSQFVIQYFPSSKDPRAECYKMIEALCLALEYITVDGDLVRGTGMRGEMTGDVLSFFVNFDMHVMMREELTPMELLELTDTTTKG